MATASRVSTVPRILVIEEGPPAAVSVARQLLELGYEVVGPVSTLEAALDRHRRRAASVAVLDVPLRASFESLDLAANVRGETGMPVVLLADPSARFSSDRLRFADPAAVLTRPVRSEDLAHAMALASQQGAELSDLRQRAQHHADALEAVHDAVVASDLDGDITYMNRAAEALSSWPFEEARGLSIERVLPVLKGTDGLACLPPVWHALREGREVAVTGPTFLMSRSGATMPVEIKSTPLRDARGRVLGTITVLRDLRQQRTAEEALARATRELSEASRIEALGRLAGGIVHDFNNLLTIVVGDVEMLLEDPRIGEDGRDLLREVRDAGRRAGELTQQLLTFGRARTVRDQVCDVSAVVTDAQRMLTRLMSDEVTLICEPAPEPVYVKVERSRLEQVIVNLCVNAKDAMRRSGTVTVRVDAVMLPGTTPGGTAEESPGAAEIVPVKCARITVTDTGLGMSERVMAQAFDPFFTTKAAEGGTGLGLATVKTIVTQAGGRVEFESRSDAGTSVMVYLPMAAPVIEPGARDGDDQHIRGNDTVLLVDDAESLRVMMARGLRVLGYRVIEAKDAGEAIRLVHSHGGRVDIVVTDVVMLGMSGREMIRAIRGAWPHVRALFISGFPQSTQGDGRDDFLAKPFTTRQLARQIRHVLSRPAVERPWRSSKPPPFKG